MLTLFSWDSVNKMKQFIGLGDEYSDWIRNRLVIEIGKSSMVVCAIAGAVSVIASAVLRDMQFLVFGLISLPVGIIGFCYMNDYKKLLEELADRDKMADMAERVSQSGSEIGATASKLDQELRSIKIIKEGLEKQIEDLKQGNDQLTSQLNYMQKIGGKLTQTHADFTKDLESIKELDEIIQSNFSKMREILEQEQMKEEDELDSINQKAKIMEDRLRLISSIYERTLIVNSLQSEFVKLASSEPETGDLLRSKIPSLNKLLTKR